ncbi:hypothetical protein [Hymenobacter sp. PAMC 26628]|uniref:hypothetical protein n=1 Tax=Hymenobacter sp. PAMC 26628 TaxID=1484118 RepID=UPI0007700781|nr:hypothetical protein [Hymenobacter sp. PAMC 26628]AMJ66789.1 hypothetical protein AXW84_16185 [Hymenobacter sp. PAMC 26628]
MSVIPSILTPEQFEQYSAEWLKIANDAEGDALAQCFAAPGHGRRTCASLPIQQLVWLVSTVGVVFVRTRFLAIAPSDGHPARFALALFATDAAGKRLSAYYLADAEEAASALHATQVPHDLVKAWLQNWTAAPAVTPVLFATAYGPLQGYTFDVGDFLEPLFAAQPFGDQTLRISFGLHEYYPVEGPLAQTFGLVLRLHDPKKLEGGSDDPFFDMSKPCPPYC